MTNASGSFVFEMSYQAPFNVLFIYVAGYKRIQI